MEKQYSVQFFTNFVENLQNLCHGYLDFEQSVEVSGYLCVEIDNIKKERFVLSEIIQSNGRSISESYCTKVFKSSPSSMIQRNNFKDITNRNHDNRSQSSHELSFPQRVPGNQRPKFGQSVISPSSSRSSCTMSQQRNDTLQKSPFRNESVIGAQRSFSINENRTKRFDEESKLTLSGIKHSSSELSDNTAERPLSDTGDTESADDGDIIIVKTEPRPSEELRDLGEPPPDEEKGESLRLPDSLISGGGPNTLLDEEFSETMPSIDFNTSDYDLQMNSYPSTSAFSHGLSINTLTIFNNIRPTPYVVDTPDGKKITCLLCRNVAWSEADFVLHMKVHPSCKECGRFLMSHMDLRSHMQKEHGRTSMFKCSFCDKVFLSKGGMMEHQRLKHEKTAPRFVCVICRHVCVRKRHLEDHIENVHKKKVKDTLDIS